VKRVGALTAEGGKAPALTADLRRHDARMPSGGSGWIRSDPGRSGQYCPPPFSEDVGGAGIVSVVVAELDLTIVYEEGEDGWVIASIPQISGVFSQGRTRDEARANVIDALRLMLSPEPPDSGDEREREQLHLTIAA
jgi:predicted RNase H-like HicB family nuclease